MVHILILIIREIQEELEDIPYLLSYMVIQWYSL